MQMQVTVYNAHDASHQPIGDAGTLDGAVAFIASAISVAPADLTVKPCAPVPPMTWPEGYHVWNVYRTSDLGDEDAAIVGFVRATTEDATFA